MIILIKFKPENVIAQLTAVLTILCWACAEDKF